jgi:hypothetical protein
VVKVILKKVKPKRHDFILCFCFTEYSLVMCMDAFRNNICKVFFILDHDLLEKPLL